MPDFTSQARGPTHCMREEPADKSHVGEFQAPLLTASCILIIFIQSEPGDQVEGNREFTTEKPGIILSMTLKQPTMKLFLTDTERHDLEQLIKKSEQEAGAQIVLAVIGRCDNYAEIPWKAFSAGTVLSGLVVLPVFLLYPVWTTGSAILLSLAVVFGTGIILALATILWPWCARLLLSSHRRETETLQYAESLFLNHEHFATGKRNGVLLMVSLFERQVVILPDTGLRGRLDKSRIEQVISAMKSPLRHRNVREALEAGLAVLVTALSEKETGLPFVNEISDHIIEEEGL